MLIMWPVLRSRNRLGLGVQQTGRFSRSQPSALPTVRKLMTPARLAQASLERASYGNDLQSRKASDIYLGLEVALEFRPVG